MYKPSEAGAYLELDVTVSLIISTFASLVTVLVLCMTDEIKSRTSTVTEYSWDACRTEPLLSLLISLLSLAPLTLRKTKVESHE